MFHREVLAAQDLQEGLRLVGLFLGSEFLNFHLLHCEHPSFVVDVILQSKVAQIVRRVLQVVLRQGIDVRSGMGKLQLSD